jgi:hypothetical protein
VPPEPLAGLHAPTRNPRSDTAGAGQTILRAANTRQAIVDVSDSATVEIANLTLTGANGVPAIVNNGTLHLSGVEVSGNRQFAAIGNDGQLTLVNGAKVESNFNLGGAGGGILHRNGQLSIAAGCSVSLNHAQDGGGIFVETDPSTVHLEDVDIVSANQPNNCSSPLGQVQNCWS